eukprot:scaffold51640_cov376-Isochrysis_galbana.AAC.1
MPLSWFEAMVAVPSACADRMHLVPTAGRSASTMRMPFESVERTSPMRLIVENGRVSMMRSSSDFLGLNTSVLSRCANARAHSHCSCCMQP